MVILVNPCKRSFVFERRYSSNFQSYRFIFLHFTIENVNDSKNVLADPFLYIKEVFFPPFPHRTSNLAKRSRLLDGKIRQTSCKSCYLYTKIGKSFLGLKNRGKSLKSLKIAPKRQNLPLFSPFKSLFGGLSCPQKGSFRGDFTFLRHAQTYPQYGNLGCRLPKNDPTRTLPHFLIPAKARRTHLSIFLVSSSKKSPLRPSFSSLLSLHGTTF